MCTFITVALDPKARFEEIAPIAVRCLGHWREFKNASLAAKLKPGSRFFCTTSVCDCGSVVGDLAGEDNYADPGFKFANAYEEHTFDLRLRNSFRLTFEQLIGKEELPVDHELSHWLGFFRAVIEPGLTPHVELLITFVNGELEQEEFEIHSKSVVEIGNVSLHDLLYLDYDCLLRVSKTILAHSPAPP